MKQEVASLLNPSQFWMPSDIVRDISIVPKKPGVYAWYFRTIPPRVPIAGCHTHKGLTLLYVGIAPRKPSRGGGKQSRRTLQDRLALHVNRNADMSTFRLSLGCLLSEQLDIQLRRVGKGNTMTFADGERKLSDWIAQNACVVWTVVSENWLVEEALIQSLSLPLNIKGNSQHPFCKTLKLMRRKAKRKARELPIFMRNG